MGNIVSSVMDMFRGVPAGPSAQLHANIGPDGRPLPIHMQQQVIVPNPDTNLQTPPIKDSVKESPPVLDASFWDIDPKKDQVPQDLTQFSFNIDQTKVQEQVGKLDFTKNISPEIMAKIAAGGPEAVSAMVTMMNTVGQAVMMNSVLAGSKITENGLRSTGERLTRELPHMVRSQNISNALREDNPLFTDPSTAPVLAAFEAQVAAKFPHATPQEIKEHSKQFFGNFAKKAAESLGMQVSNVEAKPSNQPSGAQTDWANEPI